MKVVFLKNKKNWFELLQNAINLLVRLKFFEMFFVLSVVRIVFSLVAYEFTQHFERVEEKK